MKISIIGFAVLLLIFSCKNSSTTNKNIVSEKYHAEPLPNNFEYKIVEDNSNDALEKNQLTVVINQKITIEQIATLAEKLFSTKKKQRRFYITYYLPEMKIGSGAWAISHYDPNLEIEIIGSTKTEEIASKKLVSNIDGEIIGKWYEQQYVSAFYILYEKANKTYMNVTFKDGSSSDNEMLKKKLEKGMRLDSKVKNPHGEYYIISNEGILEFYNKENKKFTTASKTE